MMLNLAKILSLIASTVLLCACVVIEQRQTYDINVDVGESFEIKLQSNATTGFEWNIAKIDPSIELIGTTYLSPKTNLVGTSGIKTFTFVARKKYFGKIVFEYKRAWENSVPPAKTKEIKISAQ